MAYDTVIVHAEVRQAYTSLYGYIPKTLSKGKGFEMRLLRGQFLEVRRPKWSGAALIPYENIRGMTAAADRAGITPEGKAVDAKGKLADEG